MCTKTKNSYGCGHCIKIIDPCDVLDCNEMIRWKVPIKDRDCGQCRSAGDAVGRGKEGRGRHAREIRTRDSRQSSYDSIQIPESPASIPHMAVSPWIASDRTQSKEKKWDTPTRKHADDLWVIEHERRMSDLDEKTSKMSLNSYGVSRQSSRRSSPRGSYEQIIEAQEVEEPEEMEVPHAQTRAITMLPYELSETANSHSYRRSRKTSRESEQSMSRHQELMTRTPQRKARFVPPVSEREQYESRQLVVTPKRHGSKTEPYRPYPQSCYWNSPMTESPVIAGPWEGQYEIIQHHPLQHDAYYPRTYQVY